MANQKQSQQKSLVPGFNRLPSWFPTSLEDIGFGNLTQWFTEQTGLTVSEDKKNVYVEASLPGLDAKDIDLTLDQGILWIKGDRQEEEGDEEKKYYYRASNSFSYRVALPSQVDSSKEPKTTYKDGVLKITFTKSPQSQAKKISVKNG